MKKYGFSPILRLKSQRATERNCPHYRIGRMKGLLAQREALLDQLAEVEAAIADEKTAGVKVLDQMLKAF